MVLISILLLWDELKFRMAGSLPANLAYGNAVYMPVNGLPETRRDVHIPVPKEYLIHGDLGLLVIFDVKLQALKLLLL